MDSHKLEVDSIIKSYKNQKILSNVYLCCKTNDIIGVFGRNGVGKSTLLKIIFGTEVAENKFIKIDNLVLDKSYLIDNKISYLPQDSFIPRHLTVNQTIVSFIEKEAIDDFLDDNTITSIIKKKISSISGGELRYLEIKLILFSKTKFSLLDEPFNGLSPILIEKAKKIILLASINKGIVITDHNYRDVLDISTEFYIIKNQKMTLLINESELIDYGYLTH